MISHNSRILLNTVVQYIRTLINILLGFYSTRIVLNALGEYDYGIYALIAGIVGMLSFFTNALSITTQRFLSYHKGQNNIEKQIVVFSNSIAIHVFISIVIILLLEFTGIFLFDGLLNIPSNRLYAAKIIYQCAILMVVTSIITSPFRAALIARENLTYISIIDVLDGIWKVVIALIIAASTLDRLIEYSVLTVIIYVFTLLSFAIYDFVKYPECIFPRISHINKKIIRKLTSFAGWTLYSTGCILGRNQGVAIVLNVFYGTVVNAAYGIAVQVSGAVNYIGSALQNAFSPRIIMSEGSGNRPDMLRNSRLFSKISFLMMTVIGIPIVVNISSILKFWLGEVPVYSELLCITIIISAILDQLTTGLSTVNRAIGDIRFYSIFVDTIKIITIPLLFIFLQLNIPLIYAFWIYPITELISAMVRFPILKRNIDICISSWMADVFFKSLLPILQLCTCYFLASKFRFNLIVFFAEFIFFTSIFLMLCYKCSLSDQERIYAKSLIYNIIGRSK